MTASTGIGAPVRRKEDFRFITGKGQYTDDINRPGQAYAYFLRSPHAHARIKRIDAKAAEALPGVLGVLTGEQLQGDKIGNLICGWMIHSKDGSPMKMAPHPALAVGKVCYVGDPVVVVVAESLAQAKDGAEKVNVEYEVLPAVVDPAKAKSGTQIHEVAPNNTIYEWHLGDQQKTAAAFQSAKEAERGAGRKVNHPRRVTQADGAISADCAKESQRPFDCPGGGICCHCMTCFQVV